MSSFICEKCGMAIVDSPDGYITECLHYPREKMNKRNDNEEELFKQLFKK